MKLSPIAITEVPTRFRAFTHKRSADFWLFESSIWLHMFASSLISIFIPILMLTAGFSLHEVILFYILYHALDIPANYLGRYVTHKYGAKLAIVLGTIFSIIFFVLYSQISDWSQLIWMALFYALYDGLYYTASLYIFIGSTKDPENTGENTGILHLVVRSASLLGPILGSALVIASEGNRLVVVAVVITMFILSLLPLLFIKEIETKPEKKPLNARTFFNNPREIKNHLSFGLYKIHEAVEGVIFPVFIFLTFENLSSVAVLAILIPVVSLLFSYAAGHIKRSQREKIIMIGAGLLALVWLLRFFIDSQLLLYASSIATGLFTLFVLVPLDANMFLRGAERGALSASMYRNVSSMVAKLILYVVLYFTVAVFEIPFGLSIIALLGLIYVNYRYLRWRDAQPGAPTSVPGLPKN